MHALEEDRSGEWDAFVLAHPAGTFFHQIAWKRVMERTFGYRPCDYYTERNGRITGIAPAFLVSNWVYGRCLLSLPFAVYGGVCAEDPESQKILTEHLERLAVTEQVQYLELRNREGAVPEGYHSISRYATFRMPLTADVHSTL